MVAGPLAPLPIGTAPVVTGAIVAIQCTTSERTATDRPHVPTPSLMGEKAE